MYAEYIKTLLKPLGIYSLSGGFSGAEIEAVGAACDEIDGETENLERECIINTAENYGLSAYEEMLPKRPVYKTAEMRRDAICALLSIDDASFTETELNKVLAGCGLPAQVNETGEKFAVAISFPGTKGIPDDIEQLKERIESILPCHISVSYIYVYTKWSEFETYFDTWASVERQKLTWDGVEKYGSI